MKTTSCEATIAQNSEKIAKKEAQVKKLQAEIKELKAKNEQLNDDMLLQQIKNNMSQNEISKLIMISKLMEESGLTEEEIKEIFSKGENINEA